MRERGFTLIELSIVLVILGMIVGGIVGGRALVHQAELQKIVKDFYSYETAFNTYISQYDAFPGDHKEATLYWGTQTTNGNGDGQIWDATPANGTGRYEDMRTLQHLVLAEMVNYRYFTSLDPYVINDNVPPSPIKGSGYRFSGVPWCGGGAGSCVPTTNSYGRQGIEFFVASAVADLAGPSMTPADAKNIDMKMDDGMPTKGKVFGEEGAGVAAGNCVVAATLKYNLSGTTTACRVEYWLK